MSSKLGFPGTQSCSQVTSRGSSLAVYPQNRLRKWTGGTRLSFVLMAEDILSSSSVRQRNTEVVRTLRGIQDYLAHVCLGRGVMDQRTTLWASWVVQQIVDDMKASVYHAGYAILD